MPTRDPDDPNRSIWTPEELARERRCINDKTCACSHTVCRDGWLDEPEDLATRCPTCYEAALMLTEVTTAPGKQRRY